MPALYYRIDFISLYHDDNDCSSWNTCRTNVQREGCSFDDILVQVLQYSGWRQFTWYDAIQRYNDAIDSLNHLCSNIEPGTNITHSIFTHTSEVTYKL